MKRLIVVAALTAAGLLSTLSVTAQLPAFVPVTDQMLQNPDPADWLMWRRTLNSWGYSPLDQINKSNVNRLKMVWSRGVGPGIQEATPLVYRGVMYLPHPSDFH
jgi:alcohol dehydrogenase (cytochrome c)